MCFHFHHVVCFFFLGLMVTWPAGATPLVTRWATDTVVKGWIIKALTCQSIQLVGDSSKLDGWTDRICMPAGLLNLESYYR
jgi:hypothetical protein